jgi:alkylation response protein AidB-like acyl-CoA dehydrogenase
MEFTFSEEQNLLRDSVRRFIDRNYRFEARRALVEKQGGFSRDNWAMFAEMGWLGAGLPEEAGGFGGGAVETAIVLEEFGRALVVEPFLAVGILAAQTLNLGASLEQRRTLLPLLINGQRLIVLAHGEPAARGRVANVGTTALAANHGRYVLTGRKSLVLGGPVADQFIVSARTSSRADDRDGITLFLLGHDAPGMKRHDYRLIDGSAACDLVLDGVAVGPEAVLGTQGSAYGTIDRALSHAIVGICAEAVGAMSAALWTTRDYLTTRKQFGVAIGSFQALQHRMADMYIEFEQSRAILHRALVHLDTGNPALRQRAVSAAKAQIGRSGKFVGAQAIQLHGGIGMTNEYSIGHYFKRLTVIEGLFGNTPYHLAEIAKDYIAASHPRGSLP